jgi:hypothetical protein
MKKRLIVLGIAICITATASFLFLTRGIPNKDLPIGPNAQNPHREANLRFEVTTRPDNTFGYNILMDGRILIHQPHIPALPGNEGFREKEDAQKVAEFVIHKIRQNIFPPSITVQELDSLGVL